MPWSAHIIPSQAAGTRPILRQAQMAVEDALSAIGKAIGQGASVDEACDGLGISRAALEACFDFASELVADRLMQRADPGAAKAHVSRKQLANAFHRHQQLGLVDGVESSDSCLLLAIYAVECGLKLILLQQRRRTTTRHLDKDDLTHDLDDLLKLVGQKPRFGTVRLLEPQEDVSPDRIHEALRYGRRLHQDSRRKVLQAARDVVAYVEENLESAR